MSIFGTSSQKSCDYRKEKGSQEVMPWKTALHWIVYLFIFHMSQQGYEKRYKWISCKCCNIEENLMDCRWKERKISTMCAWGEWGWGGIACLQVIPHCIALMVAGQFCTGKSCHEPLSPERSCRGFCPAPSAPWHAAGLDHDLPPCSLWFFQSWSSACNTRLLWIKPRQHHFLPLAASRFYTAHAGDCQLWRGISGALQVSAVWEAVCESTPSPLRQQTIFTIVQFFAVGGICQWAPIPDRFLESFSSSYEDPLTPAMRTPLGAVAAGAVMMHRLCHQNLR